MELHDKMIIDLHEILILNWIEVIFIFFMGSQ